MASAGQFHVHLEDAPHALGDGSGDSALVMAVLDDGEDAGSDDINLSRAPSTCDLVGGALYGCATAHARTIADASAGAGQVFPRAPSKRARQHLPPPLVHAVGHCALADGCTEPGVRGDATTADAAKSTAGYPDSCAQASQQPIPTRLPAGNGAWGGVSARVNRHVSIV